MSSHSFLSSAGRVLFASSILLLVFAAPSVHAQIVAGTITALNGSATITRGVRNFGAAYSAPVDVELGRFPWPRSVEARLVSVLRGYNATVIGFDVAFSEGNPADAEQEDLARRLKRLGLGSALCAAR